MYVSVGAKKPPTKSGKERKKGRFLSTFLQHAPAHIRGGAKVGHKSWERTRRRLWRRIRVEREHPSAAAIPCTQSEREADSQRCGGGRERESFLPLFGAKRGRRKKAWKRGLQASAASTTTRTYVSGGLSSLLQRGKKGKGGGSSYCMAKEEEEEEEKGLASLAWLFGNYCTVRRSAAKG